MKYQFGWAGPKLELPAFEAFAAQDDQPVLDTRMVDWNAVAATMQTDADPKGKRFAFWDSVIKLTGKHLPNTNQLLGDCFLPGSMVRMSDGTEKPIEQVELGEEVFDHTGNSTRVTRLIKKLYSGKILHFGFRSKVKELHCTPDHELYVYDDMQSEFVWVPAEKLKPSAKLLQPTDKADVSKWIDKFDLVTDAGCIETSPGVVRHGRSHNSCPRYIKLDTDLAWMLGLFLADGSLEKNRLTFNLGMKKAPHAKRLEIYLNSLGIECRTYNRKDKPSVLYCRISNTPLAQLFNSWIVGNTYTKRIPKWVFLQSPKYQLAILQGWIDGDGHIDVKTITRKGRKSSTNCKITGVSVNKGLISDFYRICNNLKIRPRITRRSAYKQSKESYSLDFNGREAVRVNRNISTKFDLEILHEDITEEGTLEEITSIQETDYEGFVYCLEVEDSHSFQIDGLAVHNCVGAGTEMELEYMLADQIVREGRLELYRPIFRPFLYGAGRVLIGGNRIRGDGSLMSWQMKAIHEIGILAEDEPGLPTYSTAVGREWGSSAAVLNKWVDKAKDQKIEKYIDVKNFDDAAKCTITGKMGLVIASSQGFNMALKHDTTEKCSWFIPSGTWHHLMHIPALDYNMRNPRLYVGNQWGYNAHRGQIDGPDGGGWVRAEFFDKWLRQSGAICCAMINISAWRMLAPNFSMR
jgi:intein/homing endonuclease